ncbi:hypothetical protein ACFQL9_13245 [Halobaculum lipolyticum]|uniref:Uncharacterized protein n=1 Tax=Halobaculum lipolyticum TaxID=3032001 RepID=A0ABD5WJD7_9EURY
MATTKLIPYELRMHPSGEASEGDFWDLNELAQYATHTQTRLGGEYSSSLGAEVDTFVDLFEAFCGHHEEELRDLGEEFEQIQNKTLAVSEDWASSNTVVEGTMFLGNYGVKRSIADRRSGDRREDGRDYDDSEEKPLYFLLYVPQQSPRTAYFILERSRRYGVKGPFHIALRQWIHDNYSDDVNVRMTPVTTTDIIPRIRSADRTVRLRLEKAGGPGERHAAFGELFEHEEMNEAIEFRAKGGDDMDLAVDTLEAWHTDDDRSFEVIDDESYDNVKLTVEENDSEETISLTKGETELRKNVDLSEIAAEGDIPLLPEISRRAHGFLSTVAGHRTETQSLFD